MYVLVAGVICIGEAPSKEGSMSHQERCIRCRGAGEIRCRECGGSGRIAHERIQGYILNGDFCSIRRCPECHGRRKLECPECDGTGARVLSEV
jgi:DnaJ-class molecular chaperone